MSDSSYPLSTDYKPATDEEIKRALATEEPSTSTTSGLNAPASAPAQTEATKSVAEPVIPDKADTTTAPTTEGLNAPASSAAQTEATKDAAAPAPKDDKASLFKPTTLEQREPVVTTGTETGTTATASEGLTAPETPQKDRKDSDVSPKGTPGSQSIRSGTATADKKAKRKSWFGKLKDKFSSK